MNISVLIKKIPVNKLHKLILGLTAFISLTSFTNWQTNFETARQEAKEKNRLLLLNFSGSDWCGPCIRMKKEIFGSSVFEQVADSMLVTVNADFPRSKKNQLDKKQVSENEKLADQYNPQGKFPYTVLMSSDGTILKSWEGLPKEDAQHFCDEIKGFSSAQLK